jgi:citrate synthase
MSTAVGSSALSLTDPRTGKSYSLPLTDDTIRAIDLRQVHATEDDFGLMSYDPAYLNTASCRSAITYIDGDVGVLMYRGYPIEELAGKVSFQDITYLLLNGELPTPAQSKEWAATIARDSVVPEGVIKLIQSFPQEAHPMAVLMSAVAAMGAYYPESKKVRDAAERKKHISRLIGTVGVLAGVIFRHHQGKKQIAPKVTGNYAADLLYALYAEDESYKPDPALVQALDILLVLHADHEQNCSSTSVRTVGSSEADPYSATAGGIGALYGPLHGGANEAVLIQLREIGDKNNVGEFVNAVKTRSRNMMGFGHRVYKNYDPRARIVKQATDAVFAVTGTNPLLEVAIALEGVALADDYFVSRKLYPNVDFYSGLIYEALGLPAGMFTVMFAVGRMPGWLAQWDEMIADDEQKIARPRQVYTGQARRSVPA